MRRRTTATPGSRVPYVQDRPDLIRLESPTMLMTCTLYGLVFPVELHWFAMLYFSVYVILARIIKDLMLMH